jgi:hypothetical protein
VSQTKAHQLTGLTGMKMHMISQVNQTGMDEVRFRLVSDFVQRAIAECDPVHSKMLKRSLQTNLQRMFNRKYTQAVCDLRNSVRETQSPAAYLLLAEAYAQSGQPELALATLDVLRCVHPTRSEAEIMKRLLLQNNGNGVNSRTGAPTMPYTKGASPLVPFQSHSS